MKLIGPQWERLMNIERKKNVRVLGGLVKKEHLYEY